MSAPARSPEWSRRAAAFVNSVEVLTLPADEYWALREVLDGDAAPDTLSETAAKLLQDSGLADGLAAAPTG